MSSVVIEFPGVPAASSRVRAQGDVVDSVRPAPRGGVRLTRRGRAVVVIAGLLVAFLAGVVLGGVSEAADEAGEDVASRIIVVNEGDTLWGIAAEIADDGEVRSVMREIERMNALDSAVIQLGQRLRVPIEA